MFSEILNINGLSYQKIYSRAQIMKRIRDIALEIKADYQHRREPPILLIVLTGGLYFGKDLSEALDKIGFRHHVDTIGLKRFSKDGSGGEVQVLSQPHANLSGRDIIVLEDIIDEGITMNYLDRLLRIMPTPPANINYAALLLRQKHGSLDFNVSYQGFSVGPGWVIGYGMDSDQAYRGLSDIYIKI